LLFAEELGKAVGDDLAEGKPTLPLIRALQQSNAKDKALLKEAIEIGGKDYLNDVLKIIHRTDALTYTANKAQEQANKAQLALRDLHDSEYKQQLIALAEFSVSRTF